VGQQKAEKGLSTRPTAACKLLKLRY